MGKRIRKATSTSQPRRRRGGTAHPEKTGRWESRILLYLEAEDPKLLDKEALKVYRRIEGTGAEIQGPVPLPATRLPETRPPADTDRVHRRLFRILFPTEKTVSLLEKLALSGSVEASISVEEIPPGATTPDPSDEKT
jgi:small subunit ribosomal protein S10